MQSTLSSTQIEAFYHDEFVADQVRDFVALHGEADDRADVIIDVGGGCGFFARALHAATGRTIRVIDSDPQSIAQCLATAVPAVLGDALKPPMQGDETEATFNLILHHLIADSEAATRELQLAALRVWLDRIPHIFVNEYIYESRWRDLSGAIIFQITKNKLLSKVIYSAARFVPSLRANTLGVGVRFRAHEEWKRLFEQAGFRVAGTCLGAEEPVALLWRLLLIRAIRRDSFLLVPATTVN